LFVSLVKYLENLQTVLAVEYFFIRKG
jgi:hypothetical protein